MKPEDVPQPRIEKPRPHKRPHKRRRTVLVGSGWIASTAVIAAMTAGAPLSEENDPSATAQQVEVDGTVDPGDPGGV